MGISGISINNMSDPLEYKVGELMAKFEETLRRFDKNDEDHEIMRTEIKSLNIWRWKVVGIVIGASGIVQGLFIFLKTIL